MFDVKRLPLKILIEKVPFLEYLVRLLLYLWTPGIGVTAIEASALRFALADVFLAFGFVVGVTAFLAIFVDGYGYLAIAGALNPDVVLLSYTIYALTFASVFTVLAVFALWFAKNGGGKTIKKQAYFLFLHCIRFYAFIVVLSYAMFVHFAGLIIARGINLNDYIDKHWIVYSIFMTIVISFVFRLFVNPVRRFIAVPRGAIQGGVVWFLVMIIAFSANGLWPVFPKGKVMNAERCIAIFRHTGFYRSLPEQIRTQAEDNLCS